MREIKFPDKKVDQDWKVQARKEKGDVEIAENQASPDDSQTPKPEKAQPVTSPSFMNLLTSLGIQAMMHLGESPSPEIDAGEINLDAAREAIDILVALKDKTKEQRSDEEDQFFTSFLPQLQAKFADLS